MATFQLVQIEDDHKCPLFIHSLYQVRERALELIRTNQWRSLRYHPRENEFKVPDSNR